MLIAKLRFSLPLALAAGMASSLPAGASAQREIVQPLPAPEVEDLKRALTRLAADPKNVAALVDAGNAALALDDIDAAIGFFGRADALDPGNPRVRLGLAGAYVVTRRPIEALRLFQEAEQAGADVTPFAAKRGLAFDLVGDNASAQQQYRLALSRRDDPRVREQLAISQAISGDRKAFEATLLPLLQAQDLSAFRTRAFGLAILKREREAVELARQVMPPQLAESFLPYLRQLPQLSAVEQVSAVHLGVFPAAGQQNRVPSAIASSPARPLATSVPPPAATSPVSANPRLTPAGPPLGRPAASLPAIQPVQAATPEAIARPVVQAVPPAPSRPNFSAVFAELTPVGNPDPVAGAVDIARLEARRDPKPEPRVTPAPIAKPVAEAAKPAHPMRIWVQLAAGANRNALAFDWRRFTKAGGETLRGKEPYVAEWGRTNRLLAGPYPTTKAADAAVKALRDAGLDSFRYQSPEGQEVTLLK